MSITIELAPDVEALLHAEAARQGQDTPAYVAALVHQAVKSDFTVRRNPPAEPGETLADALEGLVGVIDSSRHNGGVVSRLSEDKEAFGDYLEQKRREGRF